MSVTESTERTANRGVCQRLREYLFQLTTTPDQMDEPNVPKVIILKTSQTAPRKSGLGKTREIFGDNFESAEPGNFCVWDSVGLIGVDRWHCVT